jgi:hypothetical protein
MSGRSVLHQSELFGRTRIVADRADRLWHQQHGGGGLNRDSEFWVDPSREACTASMSSGAKSIEATLPLMVRSGADLNS